MKVNDWQEHAERYMQLALETGITIKEYANAYDLNENTARRYLRKPTKDQVSSFKKINKTIIDHGGDQKKKGRPHGKSIKNNALLSGEPARKEITALSDQKSNDAKLIIHEKKPRYDGVRFKEKNELSITHGRYSQPREEDFEAADELVERFGTGASLVPILVAKGLAHLNLMERARDQSLVVLDKMIKDYDTRKPKEDDKEPSPVLKKLGMLIGACEGVSGMIKTLSAAVQVEGKEQREALKAEGKLSESQRIKEAYRLRQKNSWTALETAEHIEKEGYKVPQVLMAMVASELKEPPPINDDSTVNEEELDRKAREYRDKKFSTPEMIADRARDIANIVDSGGYGDFDLDGEPNEGAWFPPNDDDDEWDDEATSEYYDEDDDDSNEVVS